MPGDGRGGFGSAKQIALPGAVTTLTTGEINRRDGLIDIVVGIAAPDGPQVLVCEWPEGALRGQPEVFAVPDEPTAFATGAELHGRGYPVLRRSDGISDLPKQRSSQAREAMEPDGFPLGRDNLRLRRNE